MFDSIDFEILLRSIPFAVILCLLILWEYVFPKRIGVERWQRWPSNLGIFTINVVMLMILPISAVLATLVSIEHKFGLFFWYEISFWPKVIFTLVVLDLTIYWQHRLFHKFRILWRIHRTHHTDGVLDVTTALRFHPVEIFLSVVIKAVVIILLGAPTFAVIVFEIILNGAAMFNHSNIRMPVWLDRIVEMVCCHPGYAQGSSFST